LNGSELLSEGRSVLKSQAFSRYIGAELVDLAKGHALLELVVEPHLLQQHGRVHGGVISYLADNAMAFAAGSVIGDVLTVEYKINYVKGARGQKLIASAHAEAVGKSLVVCRCIVEDVNMESERGVTCAFAQGTVVSVAVSKGTS